MQGRCGPTLCRRLMPQEQQDRQVHLTAESKQARSPLPRSLFRGRGLAFCPKAGLCPSASRSVLCGETHSGAEADAVHCDAKRSALRQPMQRTAILRPLGSLIRAGTKREAADLRAMTPDCRLLSVIRSAWGGHTSCPYSFRASILRSHSRYPYHAMMV